MTETTERAEPEERPGMIGRMFGVVASPGSTYEALREHNTRWDWLVPALVVAVVGMIGVYVTMPLIEETARAQAMERIQNLPQEQQEKILDMTAKSSGIGALVATPVTTFVFLFIGAGVLMAVGRWALGGDVTYRQSLVVSAYASLVGVLATIVRVPLMLAKDTAMVFTGPAILLSEEALKTFGGRFLASADLFMLWQVCLTAIGLATMTRASTGKALTYLLVIWVLVLCVFAALGGIGAALQPKG